MIKIHKNVKKDVFIDDVNKVIKNIDKFPLYLGFLSDNGLIEYKYSIFLNKDDLEKEVIFISITKFQMNRLIFEFIEEVYEKYKMINRELILQVLES